MCQPTSDNDQVGALGGRARAPPITSARRGAIFERRGRDQIVVMPINGLTLCLDGGHGPRGSGPNSSGCGSFGQRLFVLVRAELRACNESPQPALELALIRGA